MSINYQDIFNSASYLTNNVFSGGWNSNSVQYSFLNVIPDYYYSSTSLSTPASWIVNSEIDTGLTLGDEDFDVFRSRQIEVVNFMLGTSNKFDTMSSNYRVSFSDVTNITFSEKPQLVDDPNNVGDITFINADLEDSFFPNDSLLLGLTRLPNDLTAGQGAGDVFIDRNVINNSDPLLVLGGSAFWTLMHELGHAAGGLDHISGAFDNKKYTMMSYNADPEIVLSPYTLQLLDIVALQDQYGERNYTTRNGSNTYKFGQGFAPRDLNSPFTYTIWDGSGNDTIDASDFDKAAQIDLRQGAFSSIGRGQIQSDGSVSFDDGNAANGDEGNVAIAFHTVIEKAIGTAHDDILIGNAWDNTLDGGAGNDTLYGDGVVYDDNAGFIDDDIYRPWNSSTNVKYATDLSGADVLNGGSGDDELHGGAGDDELNGDSGEDNLIGGTGNDELYGGANADTFAFMRGDGVDVVMDYNADDLDVLQFANINSADINYSRDGDNLIATVENAAGGLDNHVTVKNFFEDVPVDSEDDKTLNIKSDDFNGSINLNVADGTQSAGKIYIGAHNFFEGTGDDGEHLLLIFEDNNGDHFLLEGYSGGYDVKALWIELGKAISWFTNEESKATYNLTTLDLEGRNAQTVWNEMLNFASSIHRDFRYSTTLDNSTITSALSYVGIDITKNMPIEGGDANVGGNRLDYEALNVPGINYLFSSEGNDTLKGYGEGDLMYGHGGEDTLYGDEGDDSLNGGAGDDYLNGGDGDDYLNGGVNDDHLIGGTGNDRLCGGGGNDYLIGGAGEDNLEGGSGNDTYTYSLGDGSDYIYESKSGETDRLVLTDIKSDEVYSWIEDGGYGSFCYYYLQIGSTGEQIKIYNGTNYNTTYFEEIEFSDETVWTLSEGLYLNTLDTNQVIAASDQADTIYGNGGNDTIYAYAGDDYLDGGTGDDTLAGGDGNDVYVIGEDTGSTDRIVDFEYKLSNEKIDLSAFNDQFANFNALLPFISQQGSDTYIDLGDDQKLVLLGVTSTDLIASNFTGNVSIKEVVQGTDGDDTIEGHLNNNIITTGDGNDTVTINGNNNNITTGNDNDVITVGGDSNTIYSGDGDDTIEGHLNNNTITTGNGNDTVTINGNNNDITTGDDNDVVTVGGDYNTIYSGDGDDIVMIKNGSNNTIIAGSGEGDDIYSVEGTGINNTIVYSSSSLGITVDLNQGIADGSEIGHDIISGIDNIIGGDGNDTFVGNEFSNTISGGLGDDTYIVSLNSGARDTITDTSGVNKVIISDVENVEDLRVTQSGDDLVITNTQSGKSFVITDGAVEGNNSVQSIYFATNTAPLSMAAVIEALDNDGVILNQAPVANDDTASVNEDDEIIIDALANDADLENDALTIDSFTSGANGTITVDEYNQFIYKPNSNFNGDDSFTYTVSDGNGGISTATVNVTVNPVNDAPVAFNDTANVNEDGEVLINVLANDTDIENDTLTIGSFTNGANGTVTVGADNQFTYKANENFNGDDSFTYTINDGNGGTSTATVNVNDILYGRAHGDTFVFMRGDGVDTVMDYKTNDLDILQFGDVNFEDITFSRNANDLIVTVDNDGSGLDNNVTVHDFFKDIPLSGSDDNLTLNVKTADFSGMISLDPTDGTPVNQYMDFIFPEIKLPEGFVSYINEPNTNDGSPINYTITGDNIYTVSSGDVDYITGEGNGNYINAAGEYVNYLWGFTGDNNYIIGSGTYENYLMGITGDGNYVAGTDSDSLDYITVTGNKNYISGGAGDDSISVTGNENYISAGSNNEKDYINIYGDKNYISTGSSNEENMVFIDGNENYIYGGNDNDKVTIKGDNNIINAGAGDNYISIREGSNNTIIAGNSIGDDTYYSRTEHNTTIDYSSTNLGVTIDLQKNYADGAEIGYDTVNSISNAIGGNGDDTIVGHYYNDYGTISKLAGGNGNDTYTLFNNHRDDIVITDTSGIDKIILTNASSIEYVDVTQNGNDIVLRSTYLNNISAIGSIVITNGAIPGGSSIQSIELEDTYGDGEIISVSIEEILNAVDNNGYIGVNPNPGVSRNYDPIANEDTVSTIVNEEVVIDILANDTDLDNDTLVIHGVFNSTGGVTTGSTILQVTNGTAKIVNNQVIFTPDTDFVGEGSFRYTAEDGNGGYDSATVNITVNAPNVAPVAVNDTTSVDEDGEVIIDVLSNDTDAESDTLTIDSVTNGTNGTVTIDENSQLVYNPNANFNGDDSFTYTINDGNGGTSTGTVDVTVNSVNDAPVAVTDTASVDEDGEVLINVLSNDTDLDNDALTIDSFTDAANGTVTIDENNQFTYKPNDDFNGDDSFTYTINDGNGGTSTGTVNVTINPVDDAPVAANDTAIVAEDGEVLIDILANDTYAGALIIESLTNGANGTVSMGGNGQLIYKPNANFNGDDSFTYTIKDDSGETSTAATVNVTVTPVNDAPVAATDTANVNEDSEVVIDVLANDTDVENDTLTIDSFTSGANGTVTIDGNNQFTYKPNSNFNGDDSFTYTINDGNGAISIGTVNVNVAPVNDAPVAANDTSNNVSEDGEIVIYALDNDTDLDGDSLTIDSFTDTANGTVTVGGDNQFIYKPNANFNGDDSFTYTTSDGNGGTSTATVNVTVIPVNDAPVSANDTANVAEDGEVLIDVLANDTDVENDTLTIGNFTNGTNGTVTIDENNKFVYKPNANFNGNDSFMYAISDGNGGHSTGKVNVTVTPVNDAPVAANDIANVNEDGKVLINVLANDSDVENDALTIDSFTNATNGTVTIDENNQFTYKPNPNFNGGDSFTYTTSDGNGGTSTATVNVTVNSVNDAPVAANDTASVDEDSEVLINVLANDTDIDGDVLTINSFTDATNGTVSLSKNDQFIYKANANFNGDDSFTYTTSDGSGGTSTATINVTVNPVNDAPIAATDTASVDEDSEVTINVLANDTDVENNTLTIDGFTNGSNGTVSIDENNQFTYKPNPNFNGDDSFTYTVNDGNGGTSTGTVNVIIAPVHDDVIQGSDLNDSLVSSGEGNDTIIYAGAGDDFALTGLGNDTIYGGEGDDYLITTSGDDIIYGGDGDDVIDAGSGDDILCGGAGNDSLIGDAGKDTYYFSRGDGYDRIHSFGTEVKDDNILFGDSVSYDQIWFEAIDDRHLLVSVIGEEGGMCIDNWYQNEEVHGASNQDIFVQSGDGYEISFGEIQTLVTAMASMTKPPVGQTELTEEQNNQLNADMLSVWDAAA